MIYTVIFTPILHAVFVDSIFTFDSDLTVTVPSINVAVTLDSWRNICYKNFSHLSI